MLGARAVTARGVWLCSFFCVVASCCTVPTSRQVCKEVPHQCGLQEFVGRQLCDIMLVAVSVHGQAGCSATFA